MKSLFYHHICLGVLIAIGLAGILPQPQPTTLLTVVDNPTYFTVSGRFEISRLYCGGAYPGKERVEQYKAKRPLVGYQLYLKAGKTNRLNAPIVDSTLTDEAGRFSFSVPAGDYLLLSKDQVDRARIRACLHDEYLKITDFDCLEEWWQKGLAQVHVYDRSIEDLYFYLTKYCHLPLTVPCLQYTGPRYP